jgi:hypothetical protein
VPPCSAVEDAFLTSSPLLVLINISMFGPLVWSTDPFFFFFF